MNTTPFDTQKVRADLRTDLEKAQQAYNEKPSLEHLSTIRWIQNKLQFLNSRTYQERKKAS